MQHRAVLAVVIAAFVSVFVACSRSPAAPSAPARSARASSGNGSARAPADPCPAGEFAEDVGSGPDVIFVRSGAEIGGGSRDAPFGSLAPAFAAARAGTIIALAKGTLAETVSLPAGTTLEGACATQSSLTGGVVVATGPNATLRAVRVAAAPATAPGVVARGAGSSVLLLDANIERGASAPIQSPVTVPGTCPAGDWPERLPATAGARLLYVRAGSGGTGSQSAPFGTIAQALQGAQPGTVIALAKGTYAEELALPAGVTIQGACADSTTINPAAPARGVITVTGAGAVIRGVKLVGSEPGVSVTSDGASVLVTDVWIEQGASGVAAPVAVAAAPAVAPVAPAAPNGAPTAPTPAAAPTCGLVGTWTGTTNAGPGVGLAFGGMPVTQTFNADGTFTASIRIARFSAHYTFENGLLSINRTIEEVGGSCNGQPATYRFVFTPDCNQLTTHAVNEPCTARRFASDGVTLTRQR